MKHILEETVNKLNYSEEGQKKNPENTGSLTIKPIDNNHVISVTQEKYEYIQIEIIYNGFTKIDERRLIRLLTSDNQVITTRNYKTGTLEDTGGASDWTIEAEQWM